jgi:hypothetical protein
MQFRMFTLALALVSTALISFSAHAAVTVETSPFITSAVASANFDSAATGTYGNGTSYSEGGVSLTYTSPVGDVGIVSGGVWGAFGNVGYTTITLTTAASFSQIQFGAASDYAAGPLQYELLKQGTIVGTGSVGGLPPTSGGPGVYQTFGFSGVTADTVLLQNNPNPGANAFNANGSDGLFLDNIIIGNSAPTPPANALQAGALSAWQTAINGAANYNAQAEENKVINCASDPSCNVDTTHSAFQSGQNAQLQNIDAAAKGSADWVNETGINPGLNFETANFLLTHGSDILDFITGLKDNLLGNPSLSNKSVSTTGLSGSSYALAGSGLSGDYYDYTLSAQLDVSELASLKVGDSFVTQFDLGGGRIALGEGTFTSVIDPPDLGTVQIEFQGFEPASVPEPSTWLMMILGFGSIGWVGRSRSRHSARGQGADALQQGLAPPRKHA